jgi:hypothetical protein
MEWKNMKTSIFMQEFCQMMQFFMPGCEQENLFGLYVLKTGLSCWISVFVALLSPLFTRTRSISAGKRRIVARFVTSSDSGPKIAFPEFLSGNRWSKGRIGQLVPGLAYGGLNKVFLFYKSGLTCQLGSYFL